MVIAGKPAFRRGPHVVALRSLYQTEAGRERPALSVCSSSRNSLDVAAAKRKLMAELDPAPQRHYPRRPRGSACFHPMKALAQLLAIALLAPAVTQAQVVIFTVNATVASIDGELGYTVGQPVTFTFVLNNSYEPAGVVTSGEYRWNDSSGPLLWTSVSGTGLSGTWSTRGTTISAMATGVGNEGELAFSSPLAEPSGVTVGGFPVTDFTMQATFVGFDFNSISGPLADPTVFFSNLAGTYTPSGGSQSFELSADDGANLRLATFNVTSLTISAIPEPSTYAVIISALALVGAIVLRGQQRRNEARKTQPVT
jgi:hypothetical protein